MFRTSRLLVALTVGGLSLGGAFVAPAMAQDVSPTGAPVVYVPEPTPALSALVPAGTDPRIVKVLWYALDQIGKPYLYGTRGPDAFDCSGLVDAAYRAAGLRVGPTTVQQQLAGHAVVDASQLVPGDLVLIPGADGTAIDPGHVGLYVGSGLVIQATHTGDVVRITSLSAWNGEIVAMRRIIDTTVGVAPVVSAGR